MSSRLYEVFETVGLKDCLGYLHLKIIYIPLGGNEIETRGAQLEYDLTEKDIDFRKFIADRFDGGVETIHVTKRKIFVCDNEDFISAVMQHYVDHKSKANSIPIDVYINLRRLINAGYDF